MRVSKWGNSLGIRLPAAIVSGLQLQEGDDIEIIIADDRSFAVRRKPGRKTLLKRLRRFCGQDTHWRQIAVDGSAYKVV